MSRLISDNVTMPPVKEIYLMRHAEAVSQADWYKDDSLRPLSEKGVSLLKGALPYIKKSNFSPQTLLVSPYARAMQTAELIGTILNGTKSEVNSMLAAGASVTTLKMIVKPFLDQSSLLIIGHMPDLAHFASAITSDPWLLDEGHMDPATIWALDPGPIESKWGAGKFIWQKNLPDWKRD